MELTFSPISIERVNFHFKGCFGDTFCNYSYSNRIFCRQTKTPRSIWILHCLPVSHKMTLRVKCHVLDDDPNLFVLLSIYNFAYCIFLVRACMCACVCVFMSVLFLLMSRVGMLFVILALSDFGFDWICHFR